MSFCDLYLNGTGLVTAATGRPVATVFGIPFDSTHSYKPGCRFGPEAIRNAFNNIEVFHPQYRADLEAVRIEDLGDMVQTVVASEMTDMARKVAGELAGRGGQVFILGGEHSITYGTYTAFPKDTGYVVFDAHYDLRDAYAGERLSHASYLRRISEERGTDCIIHVGARAFTAEELEYVTRNKMRTVTSSDIQDGRGPARIRDELSVFDSVYASFDMDVLDPAFAPGVGNPEAEGITSRELFGMIRSIDGPGISGVDIVEMNPQYDTGATAAAAAKIISTIVAMNLHDSV